MTAKKIMFLHHGAAWIRGSERVLLDLLGQLDNSRYAVTLVCNQSLLETEAARLNINTCSIMWPEVMVDSGHIRLQFIGLVKAIVRLRARVRRDGIQLLVSNGGLPHQVAYYVARLCGIPCIAYLHAPYTKRYIHLYRLHRADMTVFVSHAIERQMKSKVTFHNAVVIHNGIDTQHFRPVEARNRQLIAGLDSLPDKLVIGQVGSLIRRKGIATLIDACRLLADRTIDFHVVLVGDGPDAAEFMERVARLGLAHAFTFFGNSNATSLFYQHVFDINVLTSNSEAFGLTLAEGAACGLPCVGADVEGIPEVIRDPDTGLLFRVGDAADLASKLEFLIQNPDTRAAMGERGRHLVVNELSLKKMVEQFSDVVDSLV